MRKREKFFEKSPSKFEEIVLEDVQVVELAVADDEQFQKLVTPVSINIWQYHVRVRVKELHQRQIARRSGDASKGFGYGVQEYLHTRDVHSWEYH
ncbi:hypothetical protein PQX77_003762 [Marasmius sp. AFHP31]|nr:hypothetical protein PQX77_003762 [Marasmius sp. AFHP31]